jgi:hypothetical protein
MIEGAMTSTLASAVTGGLPLPHAMWESYVPGVVCVTVIDPEFPGRVCVVLPIVSWQGGSGWVLEIRLKD